MSIAEVASLVSTTEPINVPVKTVTVTVHRLFESPMGNLPNYYLRVSDTAMAMEEPELYKIVWNLTVDTGVESAVFADPGVIFAEAGAPFLRSSRTPDTIEGYWSNMEMKNRRSFPYTLYVMVDNSVVVHDPTVENQPPLAG